MPTIVDTRHRKVLIFGDEPSIRSLLKIFAEKLERKKAGPADPAALLATVNRTQFDAVLLDLRLTNRDGEGKARGLGDIRTSLVGRTLAITAEVRDPETLDLIERYLINRLPSSLLWLVSDY